MSRFHLQVRHPERHNGKWAHLKTAESGDNRRQFSDETQINQLRRERADWIQNYPQRYGTSDSQFRITKSYKPHYLDPEVVVAPGAY